MMQVYSGPPVIFLVFFFGVAALIIGSIVFLIIKGIIEWSNNNQQPVLTVPVRIAAKRSEVHRHSNTNQNGFTDYSTSTTYHATFEFESGDRKEFQIPASEFGLLVEGDRGDLTFQGTRYKGLQRRAISKPAAAPASGLQKPPALEPPAVAEEHNNAAMKYCSTCNIGMEDIYKFCPQCGKPLALQSSAATHNLS